MSLTIGIVGLPNVGKSTLFNALTKSAKADAQNFPFCTIDPNVGAVAVPDKRLDQLAQIVNPEKVVPSMVEFVDIAGLVAGASEGEGLGNQFLSHIRECDAIAHVVRHFSSGDVHHVSGSVDPLRDHQTIETELILADLQSAQKQMSTLEKKARSGDKDASKRVSVLQDCISLLNDGHPARSYEGDEEGRECLHSFHFLTSKPILIVANVAEGELATFDTEAFLKELDLPEGSTVVAVSAAIEAELSQLSPEEAAEYLTEMNLSEPGLNRLIRAGFSLLGLQNYFTAGKKEVRSWTIPVGAKAPQAAGAIHTDFEKGFICADVIGFDDFIACGGEAVAKEKGKCRMEGKEYIVKDGDVIHFKFNV